jgi:hypothetical protein
MEKKANSSMRMRIHLDRLIYKFTIDEIIIRINY